MDALKRWLNGGRPMEALEMQCTHCDHHWIAVRYIGDRVWCPNCSAKEE